MKCMLHLSLHIYIVTYGLIHIHVVMSNMTCSNAYFPLLRYGRVNKSLVSYTHVVMSTHVHVHAKMQTCFLVVLIYAGRVLQVPHSPA